MRGLVSMLKKDPSSSELNKIKSTVNSFPIIADSSKYFLISSVANCVSLYAISTIHEPDVPFRPILSNIGTAS